MLKLSKYAKYAKSITVKAPETGVTSVRLTAVYKGNLCNDEKVTVTMTENGQTHTFPEKTELHAAQTWGKWTAVRPIHKVEGTITNRTGEHHFELKPADYCDGVLPNLAFSLHHDPEHVKMLSYYNNSLEQD